MSLLHFNHNLLRLGLFRRATASHHFSPPRSRQRQVAKLSGQDLGVFRLFHPDLNPDEDPIPGIDLGGMFYLISSTLMYEFILETLPQIIIQIVNNDQTDGWSTFTYISIGVSLFVAVDSLYRQFVKVVILGIEFGSIEIFVHKDDFNPKPPGDRVDNAVMLQLRQDRLDRDAKDRRSDTNEFPEEGCVPCLIEWFPENHHSDDQLCECYVTGDWFGEGLTCGAKIESEKNLGGIARPRDPTRRPPKAPKEPKAKKPKTPKASKKADRATIVAWAEPPPTVPENEDLYAVPDEPGEDLYEPIDKPTQKQNAIQVRKLPSLPAEVDQPPPARPPKPDNSDGSQVVSTQPAADTEFDGFGDVDPELATLIAGLKLSQDVLPTFKDEGMLDLESLFGLTKDDFRGIGIKLGDANKIVNAVALRV